MLILTLRTEKPEAELGLYQDNKQIDYFKRLLFGGMGSLNDLNFDSKKLGATADRINVGLKQKMQVLFASLNG